MTPITGYCVLTNCISGYELAWRVGNVSGEEVPEIFENERYAQMSMIEDLLEDIEQFKNGDREFEEIHWPDSEYTIAKISIDEEGWIEVWDTGEMTPDRKNIIMSLSLIDWWGGL